MIRFLADACLNGKIVDGCRRREPAMDFLAANEAQLENLDDPDVLALAARSGRILVTSDFATMPGHFGDFMMAHGHSPGVILVSQKHPIGEIVEELLTIWSASDPEEWADRIVEAPL